VSAEELLERLQRVVALGHGHYEVEACHHDERGNEVERVIERVDLHLPGKCVVLEC
jgi:hypothetical protein